MDQFKASDRTADINDYLAEAGQTLGVLARENTALTGNMVKQAEALVALERREDLTKLAFEIAGRGFIDHRSIPGWVEKRSSETHPVDYYRTVHELQRKGGHPAAFRTQQEKVSSARAQGIQHDRTRKIIAAGDSVVSRLQNAVSEND